MDIKEALQFLLKTGAEKEKPEVIEICGKTYCTKDLKRYDKKPKANPIQASSLTTLVDYIRDCHDEFPGRMIIQIENPKEVSLLSALNADRERETLFYCRAIVSDFCFGRWYDQEDFVINLQTSFAMTDDLALIQQVAGNVEAKTVATYGDDGITQKATVSRGVAGREDVIVPNPCILTPYRTFSEVEQPSSAFVFRIGDDGHPRFKLIESESGLWMRHAIKDIKEFLRDALSKLPEAVSSRITIIG